MRLWRQAPSYRRFTFIALTLAGFAKKRIRQRLIVDKRLENYAACLHAVDLEAAHDPCRRDSLNSNKFGQPILFADFLRLVTVRFLSRPFVDDFRRQPIAGAKLILDPETIRITQTQHAHQR